MTKIFFSASPSSSSSNSTSVAVWCERGCGGVPAIWGGATRAAGGEPQQVVVVRGQAVRSAAGAARLAELPLARVGVEGVRVVEALALAEAAEVEDLVAVGQQRRLHPNSKRPGWARGALPARANALVAGAGVVAGAYAARLAHRVPPPRRGHVAGDLGLLPAELIGDVEDVCLVKDG